MIMKKMLIFWFVGLTMNMNAQRTMNPSVDVQKTKNAHVLDVLLTPFSTAIKLGFSSSWGLSAKIKNDTYIEYTNPKTGVVETLRVKALSNKRGEELVLGKFYSFEDTFVLIFPSLPNGVNKINLIEPKGWKWIGINITPRNDNETVKVNRIASSLEDIDSIIAKSENIYAGKYEQLEMTETSPYIYRLAFVQNDEGTFLVYMGSTDSVGTWKCGEVKANLRPTVSSKIFKADWYSADKTIIPSVITFEGATMIIHFDDGSPDAVYVRMSGGTQFDDANTNSEQWSGTGFALNGGYLLTNYHVVKDASSISIYGVNGNFAEGLKATVVGSDKSNDLSLLKISENESAKSDVVPYGFKSTIADVGEDVYVLGYPLTATMGEEVKLTNGIISAKTGFDGAVSQYQISAPIQPGNSGGPLIDYDGNVIGVVCAKHMGTENVSYAIKTSQVKNLIESVSDLKIINSNNTLRGKSLKEQVKEVSKHVYIIKCSK